MRVIIVIAVVFHIMLVAGAAFGWFDVFFHGTYHTKQPGLDLHAVYDAGRDLLEGKPIYKLPPYEKDYTPFRYLPIAAVPGMVLSLLRFDTAYIAWFILLELLMLVNLAHLRTALISDEDFLVAVCMYLFFTPFYVELFMGQYSLIQATFILFFFTSLYSFRAGAYGYWVASALWKLNTFLALPALIRFRKFGPIYWAIGLAAISLVIYGLFFGGNVWNFFIINFRVPAIYQEGNLGLRMLWDSIILHVFKLGHPVEGGGTYELSTGGELLSALLPIIVLIICLHASVFAHKGNFIDLVALWIMSYFLLYTDIWEHHYLMLLPILVLQYAHKRRPLIIICYLFIALPTPFALIKDMPVIYIPGAEGAPPLWGVLFHHATKSIPTLVFFIALWRHIVTYKPELKTTGLGADWSDYVTRDLSKSYPKRNE